MVLLLKLVEQLIACVFWLVEDQDKGIEAWAVLEVAGIGVDSGKGSGFK